MAVIKAAILPSLYQDSVLLMRIASEIRVLDGVVEAAVFMGTPANQAILESSGMATPAALESGPNDLIISVRADNESCAKRALDAARERLSDRRESVGESKSSPKTLQSAVRRMPDANLVLLSVPGSYVHFEAKQALRLGLSVMIFSDNVPVADEVELKRIARQRGLLCMGPDCGTAYVNGVGLAFHNVVRRGRIGCVAASGTGLQAVAVRLDALGEGISHGIGVGGRDLSADVGGIMTFHALELLAQDDSTDAIILVSKAPSEPLMDRLEEALLKTGKPTIVVCVGALRANRGNVTWVRTLDGAANTAVAIVKGEPSTECIFEDSATVRKCLDATSPDGSLEGSSVLGFYSGGTLAQEAVSILEPLVGPIHTNLAKSGEEPSQHLILDVGGDEFTVGRPHPMIEPEVRTNVMLAEVDSRQPGVILFDVVLGRGAHESPCTAIIKVLETLRQTPEKSGRKFAAVAAVIGTRKDPQNVERQIAQLEAAGVVVFRSNAEAARFAALLVHPTLLEHMCSE